MSNKQETTLYPWLSLKNSSTLKSESMDDHVEDKELSAARRRLCSVSNHLVPVAPPSISLHGCSSGSSISDSYHRIHGDVSTHEPVWERAIDELGIEYTDIVYEKAKGEGIAKVTSVFVC